MYTQNQLIVTGLIVAAASALITSYIMNQRASTEPTSGFAKKKRPISTTTGEPISYTTGRKKQLILQTKTETGENLRWIISNHNPNHPDAVCSGFWISQYGSDFWQCIPKHTGTTT